MCRDKGCKYHKNEVRITKEEYDELLSNDRLLKILQAAGVDNWEGYDYAMQMFYGGDGA